MTDALEESSADDRKQRQRQCRAEWRQLCETLEMAQGDELCQNCRDKYQFIKTYRRYGRDFDQLTARLKKSAASGQYQFFCDRGIPRDVLTPTFVEVLLDDWKAAIQAKKRHVAEVFRFRFRETIDSSIVTGEDSAQLGGAESMHASDALHHLSGKAQPAISFHDVEQLRSEMGDLRARLDQLSESLHAEIAALKAHLERTAD